MKYTYLLAVVSALASGVVATDMTMEFYPEVKGRGDLVGTITSKDYGSKPCRTVGEGDAQIRSIKTSYAHQDNDYCLIAFNGTDCKGPVDNWGFLPYEDGYKTPGEHVQSVQVVKQHCRDYQPE